MSQCRPLAYVDIGRLANYGQCRQAADEVRGTAEPAEAILPGT